MVPPRPMMSSVCSMSSGDGHVPDKAAPAFEDADAGAPLVAHPLHDRADDRIQSGAVAPAGQQADFHEVFLYDDRTRQGVSRGLTNRSGEYPPQYHTPESDSKGVDESRRLEVCFREERRRID